MLGDWSRLPRALPNSKLATQTGPWTTHSPSSKRGPVARLARRVNSFNSLLVCVLSVLLRRAPAVCEVLRERRTSDRERVSADGNQFNRQSHLRVEGRCPPNPSPPGQQLRCCDAADGGRHHATFDPDALAPTSRHRAPKHRQTPDPPSDGAEPPSSRGCGGVLYTWTPLDAHGTSTWPTCCPSVRSWSSGG